MINNPVIFYISSFLLIFFALISLLQKKLINSLLAAIVVFFCGAIFFHILGSEYNAIIQAAIYGIAVPIIIGLSIMFTSKKEITKKNDTIPYLVLLFSGIFLLSFVYIIMISLVMLPDTFNIIEMSKVNFYDVMTCFAKGLYGNYVWAFELLSLLLTIVIAGFTLFRKRGA